MAWVACLGVGSEDILFHVGSETHSQSPSAQAPIQVEIRELDSVDGCPLVESDPRERRGHFRLVVAIANHKHRH